MSTVYRKELKQLFTGMIGWIFIAFVLLFAGIYLTARNLKGYYPGMESILSQVSFIFLLVIPILTMRSMAEETRQKTDQLLFTSPVSMAQIVLGKFFAMVTVFAIAVAVICLYPLLLSQFGTVNFAAAYGAILAFFLFGSMLIALGLFISTLTESQIISAVVCLGVLLIVYFMSGITALMGDSGLAAVAVLTVMTALIALLLRSMTGNTPAAVIAGACIEAALLVLYALKPTLLTSAVSSVLSAFAAFDRMESFAYNGLFDMTALFYYLSVTGLFCFLSAQSLEKRRWN
mgnify:CR=1 FL=1